MEPQALAIVAGIATGLSIVTNLIQGAIVTRWNGRKKNSGEFSKERCDLHTKRLDGIDEEIRGTLVDLGVRVAVLETSARSLQELSRGGFHELKGCLRRIENQLKEEKK